MQKRANVAISHRGSGVLLAALGSIAFSGKAIIVKLAYRHGVDPVTLLMYRMLFALPFFIAIALWSSRARPALSKTDWRDIIGLGITGYYLASFLDFWGLQYISASLERLILYLNPTLVLIIGWIWYGRRIAARQWWAMGLSYAGIWLVLGTEVLHTPSSNLLFGSALVLASAISYAFYLHYSGEVLQRLGALRLVGWASCIAALLCILQFFLLKPLSAFSALQVAPAVLQLSLVNAVLCTVAPVIMVMLAIERIGSGLTAQIGMIGPIATMVMAYSILGEALHPQILWGTALVLLGIYWVSRHRS